MKKAPAKPAKAKAAATTTKKTSTARTTEKKVCPSRHVIPRTVVNSFPVEGCRKGRDCEGYEDDDEDNQGEGCSTQGD